MSSREGLTKSATSRRLCFPPLCPGVGRVYFNLWRNLHDSSRSTASQSFPCLSAMLCEPLALCFSSVTHWVVSMKYASQGNNGAEHTFAEHFQILECQVQSLKLFSLSSFSLSLCCLLFFVPTCWACLVLTLFSGRIYTALFWPLLCSTSPQTLCSQQHWVLQLRAIKC